MADKKQNVLIVHNYYQIPGGEDTVVSNEKRLLEEHGHKVILYSRDNKEINGFSMLQKLVLPFSSIFNTRTYREVKRIIRKEQIQIVHVHNTLHLISPSVYYAAIYCHVPVVQTVHNFRLLCPGGIFYRDGHICEDCVEKGLRCAIKHDCYRDSKMQTLACVINMMVHRMTGIYRKLNYICLTEFNKQKLSVLKQIDAKRIFIKPNFTDGLDQIVPAESRMDQYVYAGRLDKIKGVDILLEAWRIMGKAAPKLVFCGTGSMDGWCRRYIEENGLRTVEMRGNVPNQEVKKILTVSKALLLPTRLYEGFPMSIVEALSLGTPVIASALGNAGDLIEEGITGCRFDHTSPVALVDAINRLQGYPDIYVTAKSRFDQKYTYRHNYQYLEQIYKRSAAQR